MIIQATLSRSASILLSLLIYVLAILTAVLVARQFSNFHPLVMIGAGDVAATILVFLFSVLLNNSSAYDPYWSVKPAVIAIACLFIFHAGGLNLRQWLVLTGAMLYALRLTSNFYRDWPGFSHEDWRYVNFRNTTGKAYWLVSFLAVHLFPTIMVFLGCMALYAVFSGEGRALNVFDGIGALVLFGSVVYAFTADEQLRRFRKFPGNQGKTICTGLWKLSRHPNYFGEIMTWWGLSALAIASGCDYWWTLAGPVAITIMFLFASIPMIEKRNLERREGYRQYMENTSRLIPFKLRK
jgi:steroid 5-alpha reductase family enzyme